MVIYLAVKILRIRTIVTQIVLIPLKGTMTIGSSFTPLIPLIPDSFWPKCPPLRTTRDQRPEAIGLLIMEHINMAFYDDFCLKAPKPGCSLTGLMPIASAWLALVWDMGRFSGTWMIHLKEGVS